MYFGLPKKMGITVLGIELLNQLISVILSRGDIRGS